MNKAKANTILILLSLFLTVAGCSSNPLYNVSGKVTDEYGHAMAGVMIHAGDTKTVTTDGNGSWSATGMSGFNKFMPVKEGWTFMPTSVTISMSNNRTKNDVDFVGTYWYSVSGSVIKPNGTAIEGVSVNFINNNIGSEHSDANGKWSKSGLHGTVVVTGYLGTRWTFNSQTITGPKDDIVLVGSYRVAGYIKKPDLTPFEGVLVTTSSGGTYTTGPDGKFSFYCTNASTTITPSKSGYKFLPVSTTHSEPTEDIDFWGVVEP